MIYDMESHAWSVTIIIYKMMESAREGMRFWRPGDLRRAQDIVGTRLWDEISRRGLAIQAGKIFAQIAGELGLKFVRQDPYKAWL